MKFCGDPSGSGVITTDMGKLAFISAISKFVFSELSIIFTNEIQIVYRHIKPHEETKNSWLK